MKLEKTLLFAVVAVAIIGCSSDTSEDDKAMRDAVENPKKVTADELPDNVPQWVKDQVRAGEQRQAGAGTTGSAPAPTSAGKQ